MGVKNNGIFSYFLFPPPRATTNMGYLCTRFRPPLNPLPPGEGKELIGHPIKGYRSEGRYGDQLYLAQAYEQGNGEVEVLI